MDILRNYRYFLRESVDSSSEVKSTEDIPTEVIETAKRIASDIFDRVRKPSFEYDPEYGVIMKFYVTQQDFDYIDEDEELRLDIGEGARRKRTFDVTLKYFDRISESYEVQYIVEFEMLSDEEEIGYLEDDDEDVIVDDDWEKPEEEDDFDEDVADQQIKKGKIKIDDDDEIEIDYEPTEDEY